MYGAKAEAISKAAFATWGTGDYAKVRDKLNAAVFAVADNGAGPADLDVPAAYAHPQFVKLVTALARNPLVA
jgi:hypothetical protein